MKKNMLTKLATLSMIAVITIGAFAGCGAKNSAKDEQGRIIVSVGGWPQKEGKALDNFNLRKETFEATNKDVVINPDPWTFDRKTFYAKAAGNQLPVVYGVGYTEMPEIIASNYSADLTDVLKKRGYEGMLNSNILDIIGKDEKVFAFPNSSYVLGLAYNTEMMNASGLMEEDGTPKQPKDWYELAEFAVKIKNTTGKPGFIFPTANKTGGWIFMPVAWSFGVNFMEKGADGKWKATFDTPECAAALQYIKDLKWKYDVLPTNSLIDSTEYYKVFATGGAGMLITAGDVPARLTQYEMNPDQVGMMALPSGPKRHVTLLGGNAFCINPSATDEQIDAAIRWLETETSFGLTDSFKTTTENDINKRLSDGELIGIKGMSVWSAKADALVWRNKLIDEKSNSNPNHVRLYNEFVADCPADIQPEEPVCAQELYEILDGIIQEVITNKNADCSALIKGAVSDFQANYLDNLTY